MKIVIDTGGEVRMIANEWITPDNFATSSRRRASHVLPWGAARRWWFIRLRRWFGETGRVAAWTRRWRCAWLVDLTCSGGPCVGPFSSRDAAIAFEVAWLERNRL